MGTRMIHYFTENSDGTTVATTRNEVCGICEGRGGDTVPSGTYKVKIKMKRIAVEEEIEAEITFMEEKKNGS